MWGKGSPRTLLLGMQTGAATVENSMEVSQNIKTVTDPVIPLLGVYLKKPQRLIQKNMHTHVFVAVLQ